MSGSSPHTHTHDSRWSTSSHLKNAHKNAFKVYDGCICIAFILLCVFSPGLQFARKETQMYVYACVALLFDVVAWCRLFVSCTVFNSVNSNLSNEIAFYLYEENINGKQKGREGVHSQRNGCVVVDNATSENGKNHRQQNRVIGATASCWY